MERKQYLECGKIVNTHGIRGEIKIQPWCDSPEFLKGFKTLYIDSIPYKVLSIRIHKECAIVLFDGIGDINQAMCLKNKIVSINRDDAVLPEGRFFVQDLIGLSVFDTEGIKVGTVTDVLDMPSGNIYVISGTDGDEHLIPAVSEFIKETDMQNGKLIVSLIEGM